MNSSFTDIYFSLADYYYSYYDCYFYAAFFAAVLFALRQIRSWNQETADARRKVLCLSREKKQKGRTKLSSSSPPPLSQPFPFPSQSSFHDHHELWIQKSIQHLPRPIQKHLQQTLFLILDTDRGKDYMMHKPVSIIKTVRIEQEGEIRVDDKWLPLKAQQDVCANPAWPGFVWCAKINLSAPWLWFWPRWWWWWWFPCCSLHVRDAYIPSEGGDLDVKFMKVWPLIQRPKMMNSSSSSSGSSSGNYHYNNQKHCSSSSCAHEDHISHSELMRWLAECALYPTSFFPQMGKKIQWMTDGNDNTDADTDADVITNNTNNTNNTIHKNNNDSHNGKEPMEGPWPPIRSGSYARAKISADGYMNDTASAIASTEAEVEFHFNAQGLISTVRGYRYRLVNDHAITKKSTKHGNDDDHDDGSQTVLTPWEGHFSDYQIHDGMLIPTRIESGWWFDDQLEIVFKGINTKFEYTYYDD
jgi:hypothetical protein